MFASFSVISKKIHNDQKCYLVLCFQTTYLGEALFSLYSLTQMTFHFILKTDGDIRTQLSPLTPEIEIYKNIEQCAVLLSYFALENIVIFYKIHTLVTLTSHDFISIFK